MRQNEFDNTPVSGNTFVTYCGDKKYVISVDFSERLIGMLDDKPGKGEDFDPWEIKWARCENCEYVEA